MSLLGCDDRSVIVRAVDHEVTCWTVESPGSAIGSQVLTYVFVAALGEFTALERAP